jgi:hypothetical protein
MSYFVAGTKRDTMDRSPFVGQRYILITSERDSKDIVIMIDDTDENETRVSQLLRVAKP